MRLNEKLLSKMGRIKMDLGKAAVIIKFKTMLGLAVFISSPVLFAQTVKPPEGWKESTTDRGRTLSKSNAVVTIGNWQDLQGISLKELIDSLQNTALDGATILSADGVKPDKQSEGVFYVTRKIQLDGKSGRSVIYGCPGQPGHARIMTITTYDDSFSEFIEVGTHIDQVCKTEPRGVGIGQGVVASVNKKPAIDTQNNLPGLSDLTGVWHTVTQMVTTNGYQPIRRTYITFDNGYTTSDVDTAFSKGVEASKKENPKRWRKFKIVDGNDLALKKRKSNGFSKFYLSYKTVPAKSGLRLNGCWQAETSFVSTTMGSHGIAFNNKLFCFSSDGSFASKQSATAAAHSSIGGSSSTGSTSNEGAYRINGHVIELKGAHGMANSNAFGWRMLDGKDDKSFIIGHSIYEKIR